VSADPNIGAVELAAAALGDLTDELVLVGGCAVGLLVTDPGRTPVRQTIDVDLVTEVAPRASYYALCEKLRARGFSEQVEHGVICRWARGSLLIDVMPTDGAVLGFTNSWYRPGALHAVDHLLPSGKRIRLIAAPYFLATKLEAFASRAGGDYAHHDMEDIVTVVDGRDSIVAEVMNAEDEVREYVMDEFETLLASPTFVDRLIWLLPHHEADTRRPIVLDRMRLIAGL
jgi:hypothetical protein